MTIQHRNGCYEILFESFGDTLSSLPENRWIITDEHVHDLYGRHYSPKNLIVLPAGEGTKRIRFFEQCLEQLAEGGANRKTTIVALGGGVIGDLAGFVASAYMRGVPCIQIPTTLLAQVDSSVGGKVGIDLKGGKNLAGAFHPPLAVYVCAELLLSLDERQFNNGMAEVWKYAFIADSELADRLAANTLHKGSDCLAEVVRRCLEIKAGIVAVDEFELTGVRAVLNFGHTIGHAIEHVTAYERYLHGEAISIGMCFEAELGEILGVTAGGTADRVRYLLASQGLPVKLDPSCQPRSLIESMRRDKKRIGDGLTFSLLSIVGECKLVHGIPEHEVEKVLRSQ